MTNKIKMSQETLTAERQLIYICDALVEKLDTDHQTHPTCFFLEGLQLVPPFLQNE